MRILELNHNKKKKTIEYISKHHIYICITDYGLISLLRHIIIGPGIETWYWVPLKETASIDVNNLHYNCCDFDKAINKAVNDMYCTIYEFDNYSEMFFNIIDKVKYIDTIKTVYTEKNIKKIVESE